MKFWPTILICCLVTGCVHFQPRPLSPENTAAQLDSRRLEDAGLKKFLELNLGHKLTDWPLEKWDLNSLTLAAFYFHPDLEVARAQWLVAQAGLRTAGARPNPSVSVTPGYDSQIPGNYSPWLVPVTFDVPIETAGKRGKRIVEAEKMAESARWSYVTAAWEIRSNVRGRLLEYSLAKRRAGLLNAQLAAQTQVEKLQEGRYDAGEISRPELTAAKIALNKTQLDLGDAQSKLAAANSQLAQAVGVSLGALTGVNLEFDFSATVPDTLTSAAARRAALRGRADILGALADYAAAEADLQLQVAKQYPDVHLGPGYAWNSGNAGDNQWSLGLTLELPVLDQNQGPIAGAEAQRKLAAAKFIALQAQVSAQIDRAVSGLQVARDQMRTGQKLLDAESRQQEFAEAQLQAGAAERLDVLNAQLESTSIELTQLDNEDKLQSAIGALEDAVQSPTDQLAAAIQNITTGGPNKQTLQP